MLSIHSAERDDALALAEMLTELDILEGNPGELHTPEAVLRDGFGETPAFQALMARYDEKYVGYLLWYPAYDTDLMERKMWVSDIYVRESARGLRCGKALLRHAAGEARRLGYASMELPVRLANDKARAFYEHLGGQDKESTVYRWYGKFLTSLAVWNE